MTRRRTYAGDLRAFERYQAKQARLYDPAGTARLVADAPAPRTVHFTFDGYEDFEGVLAGGSWNGFTNVKVTPAVLDEIKASFAAAYAAGTEPEPVEDWPPVGDDGLVDLSGGYATTLVPLSEDEVEALGIDGRDGRGDVDESDLDDAEYARLVAYRAADAYDLALGDPGLYR